MPENILIEPLDSEVHDRAAFSSLVAATDNFLKKTAKKLMKGGTSKVFVAIDHSGDPSRILGFYSLNAHTVDCGDLPNRYKRYALPDNTIPAAFIGMMGVDHAYHGEGIGSILLADALGGAYQTTRAMGTAMVVLDVLNCGIPENIDRRQNFYIKHGFLSMPSDPLRMYIPMDTIENLLG